MKFQHGQQVRIKKTKRFGRVAGFCTYTHPNDTWDTGQVVHDGVIVDLCAPYYDNSNLFIRMLIVPANQLVKAERNEGWGEEQTVPQPLYRHMTNKTT